MKLAVIMPSRGLIFSQTIEELLRELSGHDYDLFLSHQRPIPECFNEPLERVLSSDEPYTHIWFVEEDMVLPEGILMELLWCDSPIATSDYPAVPGTMCVQRDASGNVLYTGTGCLLVERSVFDDFELPVFDTSFAYTPDGTLIGERNQQDKSRLYGQHDIHFFLTVRELGLPIAVTDLRCGQRKIAHYGKPGTNNGYHAIIIL